MKERVAVVTGANRGIGAEIARQLVDALVNNAGVSLDGFGSEVARRTLDVNFYGAMRVTDALLSSMRAGGSIRAPARSTRGCT